MISLIWNNLESRCDMERSGGPIVLTDDITPAVLISLLSDRETQPDRRRMDDAERRGWWGDGLNDDPADRTGSLLWTRRQLNDSEATRKLIGDDIKQALRWLLAIGFARSLNVIVERWEPPSGVVAAQIEITGSTGQRWTVHWEGILGAT